MANAQQSNTNTSADTANNPEQPERELVVQVVQIDHGWGRADYRGTRAQLEAEGVIPPGTHWPVGQTSSSWEAGECVFRLARTRPDGLKGPMRLWIRGDWWKLQWEQKVHPDKGTRAVLRKKAELVTEVYRQSPAGQRAWDAHWRLYWQAHQDKAFQSFKALIPGLIPPKRGRKAAPAA